MLRSLISNPAKTTSHTCMAFIPSFPPPACSFPFLKHTHSVLCAEWSRSNPVLFSESQSPCGFVTVGTGWSWEQDCYSLILWKEKCSSHRFVKEIKGKLERVRIYAGRIPSYLSCYTKPAPFQISDRYEIFKSRITTATHSTKKNNVCILSLHTFNFENLMIIGSNRTRTPQQERLPLEPKLHP